MLPATNVFDAKFHVFYVLESSSKNNIALNPLKNGKASHFHRTEEYVFNKAGKEMF